MGIFYPRPQGEDIDSMTNQKLQYNQQHNYQTQENKPEQITNCEKPNQPHQQPYLNQPIEQQLVLSAMLSSEAELVKR